MLPRSHSPRERQSTFYNSIGYDFSFFFLCGGELMSSLDPRHHYFLIIYVMLLPGMMHAVRNRRMSLPGSVPHCEQCVWWSEQRYAASNVKHLLCQSFHDR